MGFAGVGVMVAVATLGQTEVGWDAVKALLNDDKDARATALTVLEENGDPSLAAGINDLLYFRFVTRIHRPRASFRRFSSRSPAMKAAIIRATPGSSGSGVTRRSRPKKATSLSSAGYSNGMTPRFVDI